MKVDFNGKTDLLYGFILKTVPLVTKGVVLLENNLKLLDNIV